MKIKMNTILLLFEYSINFGLEFFFLFFLKEYYILQICLAIDIILSSFLYFSIGILYILEIFNLTVFFYTLTEFDLYISMFWIYILLKNIIRYLFFYNFFKKETIVSYEEQNEIIIQI